MVLVLHLIGRESGASFLVQSKHERKQNKIYLLLLKIVISPYSRYSFTPGLTDVRRFLIEDQVGKKAQNRNFLS